MEEARQRNPTKQSKVDEKINTLKGNKSKYKRQLKYPRLTKFISGLIGCSAMLFIGLRLRSFLAQPEPIPVSRDEYGNRYVILEEISRLPDCYTQGLHWIREDEYIESCGMLGESKIRRIKVDRSDPKLGPQWKVIEETSLPDEQFAEGAELFYIDGRSLVYQLTWNEEVMHVYTPELKRIAISKVPKSLIKEGWGITHNPAAQNTAFVSDGTTFISHITIPVPKASFNENDPPENIEEPKLLNRFQIINPFTGKPQPMLNELAYSAEPDLIYSNIYLTNKIISFELPKDSLLKPQPQKVSAIKARKLYDFSTLEQRAKNLTLTKYRRKLNHGDCLNGIADIPDHAALKSFSSAPANPASSLSPVVLALTGKYWGVVFIVKIIDV